MFKKYVNKLEESITQISNRQDDPALFSLGWFLLLMSHGYGLGVKFRLWLYKKGIFKQKKLPCYVISIGNIVVGGAGKTPMAIYVAGLLKKMGKHPVVVSRGYKGHYKDDAMIVFDGENILLDAKDSGDEPFMMATQRSFPVVVGKDRFTAGMLALDALNPDVIVLDDGFQHLNLKRDLDLLLLDYELPFGNKRFLPAGRLRETPHISSQRTDALIFTRSPEKKGNDKMIEHALNDYPDCPWFKTFHRPYIAGHIAHSSDPEEKISDIREVSGKKAVLFSGLAKNASFYHSMKELGINILDHLEFKDHYRYKRADIFKINTMAKKLGADVILTTQKDWVKLGQGLNMDLDLIVMGIKIEFEHPQAFESLLNSRLNTQ